MSSGTPNVLPIQISETKPPVNWLKIIGIGLGIYVVLGILYSASTWSKSPWMANMGKILDTSTGMVSNLLSNWWLLPTGYLLLQFLPAGQKFIAERTAKAAREAKSKGLDAKETLAAVDKVASDGAAKEAETKAGDAEAQKQAEEAKAASDKSMADLDGDAEAEERVNDVVNHAEA